MHTTRQWHTMSIGVLESEFLVGNEGEGTSCSQSLASVREVSLAPGMFCSALGILLRAVLLRLV